MSLPTHFIAQITTIVGPAGVISDPAQLLAYTTDWRKRYIGQTALVIKPKTTLEVVQTVTCCLQYQIPIVPQGGNTGLCGAATPSEPANAVIVNLSRLNQVRAIDPQNNTLTAEAGCILANVQQAALKVNRLFPLSLASEGSCQIGGNLSTNAGGINVLRYGSARDLTLGLEVVLPNGEIWDGLNTLRKNNTGYDLKQLFIGAEGTLGIITAAALKLFPVPTEQATALVAIANPEAMIQLLEHAHNKWGDRLISFEFFSTVCLTSVLQHFPQYKQPFDRAYPWYVLLELTDSIADQLSPLLEQGLQQALDHGLALDAAIAQNQTQRNQFWQLREAIPEAERLVGISIKHDISVPISQIPAFLSQTEQALARSFSGLRIIAFGHAGDGNIHYNISAREAEKNVTLLNQTEQVNQIVYDIVDQLGGSISAEHGLGQLKRITIQRYKSQTELALMRSIKAMLDPQNIMNPGKVI